MKHFILMLFVLAFAITSNGQTPNCAKFKSGKFYYPTLSGKISWRKDTIQESYNNGNLEMIWSVKWLSECEYNLTCIKILKDPYPIHVGDRIAVTITNTDGDCFTSSLVFYDSNNNILQKVAAGDMCFVKE